MNPFLPPCSCLKLSVTYYGDDTEVLGKAVLHLTAIGRWITPSISWRKWVVESVWFCLEHISDPLQLSLGKWINMIESCFLN